MKSLRGSVEPWASGKDTGPLGQYWCSVGAQTKETEVQRRKSTSQGTVDSDTVQFHRG